jgi:type IV secretion system protein VirB10
MATNLLSPKTAAPSGIPPKNIFAFIGLGILVVIGGVAMYSDSSGSDAGDAQSKKPTLQEATSEKSVGVRGDPKEVSQAADRAGVPASLRGQTSFSNATSTVAQVQIGGLPSPLPPAVLSNASTAQVAGIPQASIDAVRDTEIANARPIIADFGTNADIDAQKKPVDQIAQLMEQERQASAARADGMVRAGDLTQVSSLLAGQQQKVVAVGRAADKSWLKEYSTARRESGIRPSPMESPLMLLQGSAIEAVTLRAINSDLPGVITARTTRDIYDSIAQTRLVLPRGSLAIGEYSSEVRMGQDRLLFAFTRLVLPDGQSFDLTGFSGSDAAGRSGLPADVNNHYFRLFGTGLLIGVLADRIVAPRAVPQGTNGQAGGLSATGQILTETARSILERNRDVAPTLTIPAGSRILIEVKRDMIFPTSFKG